jgi:branched-chain amino acid aminotransferase
VHAKILHNGCILDANTPCLTPGQVGLLSGWGVFSTIRIASGVLFAFERHFDRMRRDAALLRVPFPADPDSLRADLERLIDANGALEATMRVIVVRNTGGIWQGNVERDYDVLALTTTLSDWGSAARLGVVPQARHAASRYVHTKVLSWAFNLANYEAAHEAAFDEVILLNEHGEVCECTSANLFAVFGSRVVTPPLSAGCLPGVSRELLLQEIRIEGIEMAEQTLTLELLEAADEIFVTSTTRDVLPVREIEGLKIRSGGNSVHPRLKDGLMEYREAYVSARLAGRRTTQPATIR